jgi:hypothetical protein
MYLSLHMYFLSKLLLTLIKSMYIDLSIKDPKVCNFHRIGVLHKVNRHISY